MPIQRAAVIAFTLRLILSTAPAEAQNPIQQIKLGLMTELSGSSAAVGTDCRTGFEAARAALSPSDRIGHYRLSYLYEDTQGLPSVGVSAFHKLNSVEEVDAVVIKRTAIGMPISPLSKAAKLPLIGLVGPQAFTKNNPYAFRFYPTTEALGTKLASLAVKAGKKQISIVSTDDEWQLGVRDAFLRTFTEAGGRAALDEQVPAGDTDFSALILRIRQTAPDSVFVNLAPGQTGLFVKKLREQQLSQPIFGNFYISEPSEIAKAGAEAMEGAVLTDIAPERVQVFKAKFEAAAPGASANSTVYTCYSGLAVVLQALRQNHNVTGREGLYQALLTVNSIPMPDGDLPVRDREVQYELGAFVIKSGRTAPYRE